MTETAPPRVEIRRVSIWEDYGDSNATGQAYVDGVGTDFTS